MEPEEYRQASLAVWEAMAPGWERWRADFDRDTEPVLEWMLRELAPRSGDTVLELSAGAGDTGFAAAALVGERGRLISTDFAADMVEVARRRGAELGLRNVDYRVMDAENIELDADSVDGVLCRFGYMLMADPARALSETRRVLRPGGRLVLSVWSAPDRNPWGAIAGRILVERGHMPRPEPGAPGLFAMADGERTRLLIEEAGFTAVRIEEVPIVRVHPDVDDYVSWATSAAGALALVLRRLPDDEVQMIKAELDKAFAPFAAGGRLEFPGLTLNAVAS